MMGTALTLAASLPVLRQVYDLVRAGFEDANPVLVGEQVAFLVIFVSLTYGTLLYLFTRIGRLRRFVGHKPVAVKELEGFYGRIAPSLTILIPSYREEYRTIKQAILSAALQTYPGRRIVLLVDDPPTPTSKSDLKSLRATRRLPEEVHSLLQPIAKYCEAALNEFEIRVRRGELDLDHEHDLLRLHYTESKDWFRKQAEHWHLIDHTDRLFVKLTFEKRVREFEKRVSRLERRREKDRTLLSESELLHEYRRLALLFQAHICAFERKEYENLSHEPNKAMNLNAYIGLMGRQWLRTEREGKAHLIPSDSPAAQCVPDADYLINLDADSILDPDYALRLIWVMEQPESRKIAVAQTPYSAIPGASSQVERIAGATTDIQYLIHQGFTHFDATYWVGANALMRKEALEDVAVSSEERGFPTTRYIQDRTVIEDTESSVDLILKGWRLYNYPARLSYSATPPDFGSLIIQRQRWANGGLIILAKLLRYLGQGRPSYKKVQEAFMRFHYLTSIALVNASLLALLIYPFESNLRDLWLPLTALPYFFFYGRDLCQGGYSIKHLFQAYSLNMFLLPVNLSGVLKSLYQLATHRKTLFRRTPTVMGKALTPRSFVICESALLFGASLQVGLDLNTGRWAHGVFALGMGLCFLYAFMAFLRPDEIRFALFPSRIKRSATSSLTLATVARENSVKEG